jgi:rhodanese-related sulfurtransferase
MNWKKVSVEAGLLLAVAFVTGSAANLLRGERSKLAWVGNYALPLGKREPDQSPRNPSAIPGTESQVEPAHTAGLTDPKAPSVSGAALTPQQRAARALRSLAPPKDPGDLYLEISSETALKLHDAGALFLDARRSQFYEEGHIAGARSLAIWEHDVETKIQALRQQGISYDEVMVIYCSGGDCVDSLRLAEQLALAGFLNLYIYKDGYPDWQKRGRPIRKRNAP